MLSVTLICVLTNVFVGNIFAIKVFMGIVLTGNALEVMVFAGKFLVGKFSIRVVSVENIWQKCFFEGLNLKIF
jgi:hypothetical protein